MNERSFKVMLVLYDDYCECNETLVEHKRVLLDQFPEIINAFLNHPEWRKDKTGIEIQEMVEGEP